MEHEANLFQKGISVVAALLHVVCIVISATNVQLLQNGIPDWELNVFTSGMAFLASTGYLIASQKWPTVTREEWLSVTLYSIITLIWPISLFIDVRLLPIGTVESIVQTSNIALGIVLFYFCLGEKPTLFLMLSAVLCVSGVILVVQPEYIFHHKNKNNQTSQQKENYYEVDVKDDHLYIVRYIFPVITGASLALDLTLVKKIPYLSNNMSVVLFWAFLSNTIVSAILMLIFETMVLPHDPWDILYIFLHCLSYSLLWPFYIYGIRYISANFFNIICSLSVILMLVAQYTVLKSILPGKGNWLEVCGIVLVFSGVALTSLIDLCHKSSTDYIQFPEK